MNNDTRILWNALVIIRDIIGGNKDPIIIYEVDKIAARALKEFKELENDQSRKS